MASTHLDERQYPLAAIADLGISNIGASNTVTVRLPQAALLTSIQLLTVTAFNSETTATATVSDGTTTFVNAVDIKSTGSETVANVPKFYPTGGTLTVTLAETGAAATAGRAIFVANYVQLGVCHRSGLHTPMTRSTISSAASSGLIRVVSMRISGLSGAS